MVDENQIIRTLSIVRQLSEGKILKTSHGVIAMGEDMSIGFAYETGKLQEYAISGLATMDLKTLNRILEEESIGITLPL